MYSIFDVNNVDDKKRQRIAINKYNAILHDCWIFSNLNHKILIPNRVRLLNLIYVAKMVKTRLISKKRKNIKLSLSTMLNKEFINTILSFIFYNKSKFNKNWKVHTQELMKYVDIPREIYKREIFSYSI